MSVLERSRSARIQTRMGPALRDSIESYPGLTGMSLFVDFADVEDETVAYTDGRVVCAGPKYDAYSSRDKVFICQHELLHVALGHPARAQILRSRLPDFNHKIFNEATDAIINAALSLTLRRVIPDDAINLEKVLKDAGQWAEKDSLDSAVAKWSSESLYFVLRNNYRERFGEGGMPDMASLTGSGEGSPGTACVLREATGRTGDECDAEIRAWAHRLKQAAGTMPGLMRRLARDLPEVKTPWERLLRDFLYRHCAKKRVLDFSRPSRRFSALEREMREFHGVEMPFQPATRPGPSARLAVAVDTSGSITPDILNRFSAEIASIMARTGSEIRLIVCDAAVHQIIDLKGYKGQQTLRHFVYLGGGGTDFKPAIEAAKDFRPDAMVFLTDLEGDAGAPPPFPMLWACIGTANAPYGVRIELH